MSTDHGEGRAAPRHRASEAPRSPEASEILVADTALTAGCLGRRPVGRQTCLNETMGWVWGSDFARVPEEDWVDEPLENLALKYDTVENHGWYRNLEPTLDDLAVHLRDGHLVMDYSAGTGILLDRLLRRLPDLAAGFLLVDSSPKFLRLALEKLGSDPRTGFRLIRYLKAERRLQLLHEALPAALLGRFDVICSTNAIHLYYDLAETLRSWAQALCGDGRAFIQSGNIRNPSARPGDWIIDATVEKIHQAACAIARSEDRFAPFREHLQDGERMRAYETLRRKFFLPVKPLDHYANALAAAGFAVQEVTTRSIRADVEDWYEFLAAYHEGVLGWAGGSRRVDGADPAPEVIDLRLELMRRALDRVFAGESTFRASWTYITCRKV